MSIKRSFSKLSYLTLGLFVFLTIITTKIYAQEIPLPLPPSIDAKSWVLLDYDSGRVLISKNPDERRAPASLTKLMTEYVVASQIKIGAIHMNDLVRISKHAWLGGGAKTDGSTSFLKVHSEVSLENLLHGMIIQSGNDAAIALAEHVSGSEEAFTHLMNAYAKKLGMKNTHYSDASGYPVADHYSSARDIAILSRALIHDFPKEYAISSIKEFKWNGIKQRNRNALLWQDSRIDGIKTGHTAAAGYCLDASELRGHSRLIAVVLGASTNKARAESAMSLLEYGFQYFKTYKLYEPSKPIITSRLWEGKKKTLQVGVQKDVLVTIGKGRYGDIKTYVNLPTSLIAPYKKGTPIGTLKITLEGKTLKSVPLVALSDAPRGSFFSREYDSILLWFHTHLGKS
ncbi:MAG: D-alanyl-D-alanine carboxypeptidase family protein [Sulfurospirillaceae bacterium]|nr:D-alanyl-D-alanine carboxypeptidase family protein [Sulfurospirillaceae bacterium]